MDTLKEKRHICILCKRKKNEGKMLRTRAHWSCLICVLDPVQRPTNQPSAGIRVLNLYAGIGGNRKYWTGCHVTAVEINPKVAAAYKRLYPEDMVIIGDGHKYLIKNHKQFDVIWSSPPCQSHSLMNKWTRHDIKRYPDMDIYQEIIFLRSFFTGPWIIENVKPYYTPLIPPNKIMGRHYYWSNIKISDHENPILKNMITTQKETITDWLGINIKEKIYLHGNDHRQIYRNAVHPDTGLSIFKDIIEHLKRKSRLEAL